MPLQPRVPSSPSESSDDPGVNRAANSEGPAGGLSRRTRIALFAVGASTLIAVAVIAGAGTSQQAPQEAAQGVPAPVASVQSGPASPASSPTSEQEEPEFTDVVSEADAREYTAQYAAVVLARLITERSAELGEDGYLQVLRPLLTPDAFDSFSDAVREWDWQGCVQTRCAYYGEPKLIFEDDNPPGDGEFHYRIIMEVFSGQEPNGSYVSDMDLAVSLVENDEGEWVASSAVALAPIEVD